MTQQQTTNNKQQTTNNQQPCLHIGCGLIIGEGWQNYDASPSLRLAKLPAIGKVLIPLLNLPDWSPHARYGNIVKGLNIAHNSCDLIYASHVLEHLSLTDFHIAMRNIYAYLKPQGIFRAVVPDLEYLARIYLKERGNETIAHQAAVNFMTNSLIGYNGSRKTLLHRLRGAFSNNRHQWMWDAPTLKNAFCEHGFQEVRSCEYGDWRDRRFANVEHPESFENAVCVEGVK